jgi:hypothetical protein
MSWFTEQERQFLWGALENYLEDEAWSEMLEEEDGIPFDAAVVKSAWVKLDRFDQYGPIGPAFTEQEQALLWGLMSSYVGTLECSEACTEQNPCPTDDDCISYHDLAVAIIRKLPAPGLQHNLWVDIEQTLNSLKHAVFKNSGETTEEYIARVQALHAQRLQKEAEELAALERMLGGSTEPEARS